jgi:DNA topoisomerase-1
MKKLLIVESPAKIKTISKFLDKDFKIMSTVGHVKDLPTSTIGVSFVDDHIALDYTVLEGKEKVVADICKEASRSDEIYLAPDPDREGEIIAWHIGQEIEKVLKKNASLYRISYNEITKSAIEDAVAHPRQVDMHRVAAQQARRVLDRWVGYEVSPILWQKITKGLSAGRVQSVALKFICDREEAIRSFKPEEYWSIEGAFKNGKIALTAPLTHIKKKKIELKDELQTKTVIEALKKASYSVTGVKDSQRTKNSPAPFMTSSLQQNAYNQLGFSVQKTMQVAQNLYEGVPLQDSSTPVALITYMRTDSLRIADSAVKQVRTFIGKEYGTDYLPVKAQTYSRGKGQDAHEAIRPIDVTLSPEKVAAYLSKDQARLYELIWKRFVGCQMKPAQYAQRQVTIDGEIYSFRATGSTLMFDGYLKVYSSEDEDEQEAKSVIPKDITEGMPLELTQIDPKQHFTQAPPRYTEGSLVKELEKEGIGRPSTYATILKTILARSYTSLDTKKRFLPTELGMVVTKLLTENLPDLMSAAFTARMEENLDQIAQGSLDRDKLLKDFYQVFEKDLTAFRGGSTKKVMEVTTLVCPECGVGKLAVRMGKMGAFLGCNAYPACSFTSNFERTESGEIVLVKQEEPKLLEEPCPKCGKPLRKARGKFGEFIACSGYPDCKYIHQNRAHFKCLLCKEGDVVEKNWKGKTFWGCSTYPTCKFSISGQIEQVPCPQCRLPYLLKRVNKTGETILSCSSKECGYTG